MTDPLAQVVTLLEPTASFSKLVSARGPWRVHRAETGRLFYCAILEGASRLAVAGHEPLTLRKDDFVLVPSAYDFTTSSVEPPEEDFTSIPVQLPSGEFRLGVRRGPPDVRMVIGYAVFGSPDASLLVSLLPRLVHVRGQERLSTLVQLVGDESRQQRPARDVILARLLEVLLLEALRSTSDSAAPPGLLRGLSDPRLSAALRRLHDSPTKSWTVVQLAKEAGLSRSTFFERFTAAVGVAPMEYLLGWRMALAKDLLRRKELTVAELAQRVGYGSASTFSVAFTRHVGVPPSQYARQHAVAP